MLLVHWHDRAENVGHYRRVGFTVKQKLARGGGILLHLHCELYPFLRRRSITFFELLYKEKLLRLRIWDCGLRIADCGLRIADCGLRISDCGFGISDCGLRIWDYEFGIDCKKCRSNQRTLHYSNLPLFLWPLWAPELT
jgi:hypothetical protein